MKHCVRVIVFFGVVAAAASGCQVKNEGSSSSGSTGTSGSSSSSSSGSSGTSGTDASTANDGGDAVPDPSFLPIPTSDATVRVTVEGTGWTPYDRSCGTVDDADSYHSIGFERAYVQMSTDGCTAETDGNGVLQIARAGGLVPGVYDIKPDGTILGQVALAPTAHPPVESQLDGRLWIKTATSDGSSTTLEASYFGTTRWPSSAEQDAPVVDVTVKAAFRVRLRNIDVP